MIVESFLECYSTLPSYPILKRNKLINFYFYNLNFLVVTCPEVRKIDNVNILPVKCLTHPTNYNDGCAYSCKPGFEFIKGDQKRVCSHDGTWIGEELVCQGMVFFKIYSLMYITITRHKLFFLQFMAC